MSKNLTVVAHIRAKAGYEEQVREALLSLIEPTRAEAGCVNYELHCSLEDAALFFFYENWVSRAAWEEHLQMPHLLALQAKAGELLAEAPGITLWESIG